MRASRWAAVALAAVGLLVFASTAAATHETRPSDGLRALGHSPNPGNFMTDPPGPTPFEANSDLAFWGKYAFQGNYNGFRIIDISNRRNPQQISRTYCEGSQGDIVVWENILVRSYNSPAPAADPTGPARSATLDVNRLGGETIPAGWEGVHVFDISNKADPQLIGRVELAVRLPYGDRRTGSRQQPSDRLQPDVGRPVLLHGRHRGAAWTTRATPSCSVRCRSKASTRVTTPGSSSAT